MEWLTAVGQRVGSVQEATVPAAGAVALPTAGRTPGLYLLRLWRPDGQPLPVRRVLLQ
ncbi:hypothetical protein [Hymenobacter gummosus]|uniref:hypothetical protein n=1 Tax=Hymenobacter gummosus TaxID=1776032 RepID=UPI001405045B|nr:hypothetical protein [Hymenobacter gummosus]